MNNSPNCARLAALAVGVFAFLAACRGQDAATSSSADAPEKPALTTAQAQALSDLGQALSRPVQGLPTATVAGGLRVDLQGGYQHAVMVQVNPDGTHTFVCTDSVDTATEFLTSGASVNAHEK